MLLGLRDLKGHKGPQEQHKGLKVLLEEVVPPVPKEPKVDLREPQVLLDQQDHRMLD